MDKSVVLKFQTVPKLLISVLFGSTIWRAEERKQRCLYSHPRIESIFILDLSVSATQAPSRSLAAAMHALRIRRELALRGSVVV